MAIFETAGSEMGMAKAALSRTARTGNCGAYLGAACTCIPGDPLVTVRVCPVGKLAHRWSPVIFATSHFYIQPKLGHRSQTPNTGTSGTTVPYVRVINNGECVNINVGRGKECTGDHRWSQLPDRTNSHRTHGSLWECRCRRHQVGTINSGSSGCFNAAFAIPISLAGSFKIAIRVQQQMEFFTATTGSTIAVRTN